MKFWITLEDHESEVEFHTDAGRVWVTRDGRQVEADFRRLPDGEVYSLLIGGRSHEVRVASAAAGNMLDVSVGGTLMQVDVRQPLERLLQTVTHGAERDVGETVRAPMPGLVVSLSARLGETIQAGGPVAVVEAMKMQNELVTHRGGIVSELLVQSGDTVSANQALVRLKPVPA